MRSASLDRIIRQRDPELLKAVEYLSKNETATGINMLQKQGRVTEISDGEQRIAAIAKLYSAEPTNTIVVSPDNASRREINLAVRRELQAKGGLSKEDRTISVLTPRSDMTGADRAWAARYETGDVLHYVRGSKEVTIEPGSYARVVETEPKTNVITVEKSDGERVVYDPSRLRGISAYREIEREFAVGDRVQFTAPNRDLQVANRDIGTVKSFDQDGRITLRMDTGKEVFFDPKEMRHFDHGYAVTSHSSQGITSERVIVNMDTRVHPELINARFAYVSVSRASHDVQVFTNDVANLAESLIKEVSKTSAVELRKHDPTILSIATESPALAKKMSGSVLGLAL